MVVIRSERNLFFHRECRSRSCSVRLPLPRFSVPRSNKTLHSPRDIKSPIILQVSQGGSAYYAGKGLANDKQQASILGAVAAALHIRTVAKAYGV
jgi:fructose-bisphosphate aldolase class II